MPRLREVLDGAKPKTKIKIGSVDGSAWYIITNVQTVLENTDEIDKALHDYLEARYVKAEESLALSLRNPMDIKAYMNKQYMKHKSSTVPDFSWEGYMAEFEKYRKILEGKRRSCVTIEDARATAKPLLDREVIDVSKSIGKDGYRIIVEGLEEGLWWDASEKKKGDKIYGFRSVKDSDDI